MGKKTPNHLWRLFASLVYHTPLLWSDRTYLKIQYRARLGQSLDLKNPQTFSEKLQWLKLYNRRPEYTMMVDKVKAKEYVADIVGKKHIIPTLGVWDDPDEIDFNLLPDRFVMKCNHNSGLGMVICKEKSLLDISKVKTELRKGLRQNYFMVNREWPYKNVERRILAEQYIDHAPNEQDLADYKWYCFNGNPKYCQVIQNRSTKETIDFFDAEWNHQEFVGLNPAAGPAAVEPKRPINLEIHLQIARELSRGIPFVRVDLYDSGEQVYFGEITFFPLSGFGVFSPDKYNQILGQMISI